MIVSLKKTIDKILAWIKTKNYVSYGTAIDITSYTSTNRYTAPSDGLFQINCNYRAGNYIQGYVDGVLRVQGSATGNTGMVGNIITSIPVFKGQTLYATKSSTYSYAYFIPYVVGGYSVAFSRLLSRFQKWGWLK